MIDDRIAWGVLKGELEYDSMEEFNNELPTLLRLHICHFIKCYGVRAGVKSSVRILIHEGPQFIYSYAAGLDINIGRYVIEEITEKLLADYERN